MKRDWEKFPLRNIVEIASGQVDPRQAPYCDMIHVGGDNIESHSGKLLNLRTASEQGLISGKYRFDQRDVLYSKIRPALNKVVAPAFEGICSADIYPLRPINGRLCREYLVHLLRSDDFLAYTATCSSRTNIPKINRDALFAYEAVLPAMAEQRRIAAILDKADAIRRKREEGIRLTEELLRSTFLEMVGPANPDYITWPGHAVEELAASTANSMRTGPFGSTLLHSEFVHEGIAVLGIDNAVQNRFAWGERRFISTEKYNELKRYTALPGDVIVTIMGTTGRSAVVPDDLPTAITTKHLATITVNRAIISPQILSESIFRNPHVLHQIRAANRGAIMEGLNLAIIRKLIIHVPPIEVQDGYGLVRQQILKSEARRCNAAASASVLFDSLVHNAFRGQL
jgi:type I restriction enzyme, S subunit